MYIVKYIPCAGAAYIPTPIILEKKRCLVNIENRTDSKCFIYSVLAFLYDVRIANESTSRNPNSYKPFEERLNMSGKNVHYTFCLIILFHCN